ncbi:MAG: PEGA domain-containing protein, partial [FCB group bacterium]|nr:PEGA domain-containing protein [FCB group bacterium]
YELATGKNPLKSSDLSQALNLAVTHVPEPVIRINATIPKPLAAIIERMIAQAPDRRYPNCEQILEDLRKIHFPASVTTKEPESEPISLPVKQRRRFSSLAGVTTFVLAVAITVFAFRWTSTVSNQKDKILPPVTATPTAESISDQNSDVNPRPIPESMVAVPTAKPDSTVTGKVEKAPEPKTLPATPQFSDLTIIVYPWANVYLDSNFLGSTPLDSAIRVNPGQHQIRFRNPRFPAYDASLSVTGPRDTLVFRWTDIFGFVRLTVNPWANVYIDGAFIDATPLDRLLPLKAGDHHVILKNPDFPLWQKFIRLTAGDTVDLKVQLIG